MNAMTCVPHKHYVHANTHNITTKVIIILKIFLKDNLRIPAIGARIPIKGMRMV